MYIHFLWWSPTMQTKLRKQQMKISIKNTYNRIIKIWLKTE